MWVKRMQKFPVPMVQGNFKGNWVLSRPRDILLKIVDVTPGEFRLETSVSRFKHLYKQFYKCQPFEYDQNQFGAPSELMRDYTRYVMRLKIEC